MNDLLVNKEAIRLKYKNDLGLNIPDLNDMNLLNKDDLHEESLFDLNLIPHVQKYIMWLETLVSEKLTEERKPIMSMGVNYHNIKRTDDMMEKFIKGFGYEKSNNPGV